MPIYEYRCADCRAKTSVLVRSSEGGPAPVCGRCGSGHLVRLISRFAAPRSEEARMERMADPSAWSGVDENDPASVSRFVKRMGREMGDEFGGGMDGDLDGMADREMQGSGSDGGGMGGAESDADGAPDPGGPADSEFGDV
jgi:putative FmdB family regulatory protein